MASVTLFLPSSFETNSNVQGRKTPFQSLDADTTLFQNAFKTNRPELQYIHDSVPPQAIFQVRLRGPSKADKSPACHLRLSRSGRGTLPCGHISSGHPSLI